MSLSNNFPAIRPSLLLDFANTKTLDPRITFTRGSTGTFYDGKTVAKAEENLLLRSQELDDGNWLRNNATVTANTTTAPDGTNTADSVIETSATGAHFVFTGATGVAGLQYVYSVFAKANTRSWIQLGTQAGISASGWANFDISTGVVGNVGSGVTASITSVGNGWYRCSFVVTAVASGTAGLVVGLIDANTASRQPSYVGDGTSSVFIWGAQLEQRSSVTAYTPTTTAPITNYIPALQTAAANVARFEHNPVTGESLGLEIEEQRTNLSIRSQEFDQWSNIGTQVAVFANTVIAPDGTLTADKVAPLSGSGNRGISRTFTGLTGSSVTTTVYAKAAERSLIQIRWIGGGTGVSGNYANFNLIDGTTAGNATLGILMTPVGNGWWRCVASTAITGDLSAATLDWAIEFIDSLSDGRRPSISSGNGFNGVYLWGAQLEAGSFATSYIPTVATQVTRSADVANMTGTNFSSWYRADEGTLYADFVPSSATNCFCLGIDSGVSTAFDSLLIYNSGSELYARVRYPSSTAVVFSALGTLTARATTKMTFALKTNDFAGTLNAGTVATDTSGSLFPSATKMYIGSNSDLNGFLNGTLKKLAYYPRRLTNAELQGLTTV